MKKQQSSWTSVWKKLTLSSLRSSSPLSRRCSASSWPRLPSMGVCHVQFSSLVYIFRPAVSVLTSVNTSTQLLIMNWPIFQGQKIVWTVMCWELSLAHFSRSDDCPNTHVLRTQLDPFFKVRRLSEQTCIVNLMWPIFQGQSYGLWPKCEPLWFNQQPFSECQQSCKGHMEIVTCS